MISKFKKIITLPVIVYCSLSFFSYVSMARAEHNVVYVIPHQSFACPEDCLQFFRDCKIVWACNKLGLTLKAATYQSNFQDAAFVFCLQYPRNAGEKAVLQQLGREKVFGIILEPPSVFPQGYEKKNYSLFKYVFTWHDGMVDGQHFIKIMLPYRFKAMPENLPPFAQRKPYTLINGRKMYPHPDELYSARIMAIRFFKMEFYGNGWDIKRFPTYRGKVESKIQTLGNYKFCFCFENIQNTPGYISEKIGDCFAAGCVPIYWGAPNISKFIPNDCYIDMRQFDATRKSFTGFKRLACYLETIDEISYNQFLAHIRKFLASQQTQIFSYEFCGYRILRHIFNDRLPGIYNATELQQFSQLENSL